MGLEISLLGRFSVRRDGREVPAGAFGGRLSRVLVRVLVTANGSVVTRDALIEALWGDRHPPTPLPTSTCSSTGRATVSAMPR